MPWIAAASGSASSIIFRLGKLRAKSGGFRTRQCSSFRVRCAFGCNSPTPASKPEATQSGGVELRSRASSSIPPSSPPRRAAWIALTYLVNELRAGDKAVPYSMVAAVDAPSSGFLPAELDDNEIVINEWLAEQLGVGLNQHVTLKYFVMGERRQLTEQSREFEVIQILPMSDPHLDSSWMPDFPGLSDKANCRDWQPGFALDNTKIRDEDEAYWQKYRGTPKAFVNISIGQKMWQSLGQRDRDPLPGADDRAGMAKQLAKLTPECRPELHPLRDGAPRRAPVDFGELFVSFSFSLSQRRRCSPACSSSSSRAAQRRGWVAARPGTRPKQVRRLFTRRRGAGARRQPAQCSGRGAYTKLVPRALATVGAARWARWSSSLVRMPSRYRSAL